MRNSITCTAAALLASTAPGAAGQQPASPPVQPSRWHLDGSTSRCVLSRRLEGTPMPATFILRTIPGSQRYELILAGRDLPAAIRRNGSEIRLALSSGGNSYQGPARVIDLPGELGHGVVLGPFRTDFARQFAGASSLRLSDTSDAGLGSWSIPGSVRAAEALAYCEAEKQIEWGADAGSVEPGATPPQPVGNTSAWLTTRDLGITDALASAAFTAMMRLVVEPNGRASSCTLLETATNLADPEDICRTLAQRARFEPARNAQGAPVRAIAIHFVSMRVNVDFIW